MTAPRPFWACDRCRRVVPGRAYVWWAEGMTELEGWRCAECVGALLARQALAGAPMDAWVSGVAILDRQGSMAEAVRDAA